MATDQQLAANRANAAKSTGPRTDAGKSASARNATTSGLYAQSLVIHGEDPAALDALRLEYAAEFDPRTAAERDLLDTLVHTEWLRRRVRVIETAAFNDYFSRVERNYQRDDVPYDHTYALGHAYDSIGPKLDYIRRRLNGLDRTYRQTLHDLRALQAERRAAESAAQPQPNQHPRPKLASFRRPSPAAPAHPLRALQSPPPAPAPAPPRLIK